MGMKKTTSTFVRAMPYILLGGGGVGLIASFILTIEKIALLKDPSFQPSCNLNPIFNCLSVATTPQAEVLGAPNMLFGILAFAMVIVVGAGMFAGAKYARWFWWLFAVGATAGFIFIHWLFYQSVYVIGALCVYCMTVWAVTAPIFWYCFLYLLQQNYIPWAARWPHVRDFLLQNHGLFLAAWYAIIMLLIVAHFWDFFSTLL